MKPVIVEMEPAGRIVLSIAVTREVILECGEVLGVEQTGLVSDRTEGREAVGSTRWGPLVMRVAACRRLGFY